MTLIPAYGRDYKSKKAVLADFDAGKDFIIASFDSQYDGKPVNKEQLAGKLVKIRYNGLRSEVLLRVGE